jgi:hypothetical protein
MRSSAAYLTVSLAALGVLLGAPVAHAQDVGADPTYGSVTLARGFLPDPHTVDLTAGGSISVSRGDCDYGRVADPPDYDLYYESETVGALYISVISEEDTTLLVNTPDGRWRCDDDSYGDLDPILVIPKAASGLYDIWVGTYGEDLVSATLYISEVDPR